MRELRSFTSRRNSESIIDGQGTQGRFKISSTGFQCNDHMAYENTGEEYHDRGDMIRDLEKHGYTYHLDFEIMDVPNIVNITYGRDVGYVIEQENFDKEIESISGTSIRNKQDSEI